MAAVIAAPMPTLAPKKKSMTPKAKRAPATHPAWAAMMEAAVKAMNEKGGSSSAAIKKYILVNFQVDAVQATPHMRRGLKVALLSGKLVQAKGKGLTGSFKLGKKVAAPKKAAAAPKKVKKTGAKKSASPKKATPKVKKVAKPKVAAAPAATGEAATKKAAKPKKTKAPAAPKKKSMTKKRPASPMKVKTGTALKSPKAPKPKTTKKVTKKAAAPSAPKK